MELQGMVAIVQALPDAGLTMSLLDGKRQYTLMPNNTAKGAGKVNSTCRCVQVGSHGPAQSVATELYADKKDVTQQCHSAAQAVDGRYASVYQMSHCSVRPTSPPVMLTEFPPQRVEPCRGESNFVVGGMGSGETSYNTPTKTSQTFRGAMNWPDRLVYIPRQSNNEPDPFAHSLRKYPNLSADRSAEIVERLVNYTAINNSRASTKNGCKSGMSPTRFEAFVEAPTRDCYKKLDYETAELRKPAFGKNYDVRHIREITKRAKESFREISTYPYNQPLCPDIKERYDHLPPKIKQPDITKCHMETQAEIAMVSKEVTTLPRTQPITRSISIPLSQSSSERYCTEHPTSTEHQNTPENLHATNYPIQSNLSHKAIQTTNIIDLRIKQIKSSVHTCISSIDIQEAKKTKIKLCRKTKSQEQIRISDDMDDELLKIVKKLSSHSKNDTSVCIRNFVKNRLKNINSSNRSDKTAWKIGKCMKDLQYYRADYKHFKKELSKELFSKINSNNKVERCSWPTKVLRADVVQNFLVNNDNKTLDKAIKDWFDEIPVKSVDYLGRSVKKERVLQTVADKIKSLILNKAQTERDDCLKPDIIDIIDDVPIEVNTRNKMSYLNTIANDLIKKVGDVFSVDTSERKRWQNAINSDKTLRKNLKRNSLPLKYDLPSDIELKRFVKDQLKDFINKFNVKICLSTEKEIQVELVDILIDSFNDFCNGEEEKIKREIQLMLSEFINISEHEGTYFVSNLIYNFNDLLKELHMDNFVPQTFVVLRNTVQNSSNQTTNDSKENNAYRNNDRNLDKYTQLIVGQINEWMQHIKGLNNVDASFKKLVARHLAGDIIDRYKYLVLNKSVSTIKDELELLKYQIFKWINKLTENNIETIEHASELMERIQNIPKPMFIKQNHNNNNSKSTCFKIHTTCNESNSASKERKSRRSMLQSTYSNAIFCREQSIYTANVSTKTVGVTACPDQTQKSQDLNAERRNVYTETIMPEIPEMQPRSTSMTKIECPRGAANRQKDKGRRFSSPSGFNSNYNNAGQVEQIPAPAKYNEQQISRPSSPVRPPPLCCDSDIPNPETAIKQLKDEYDRYLQTWVMQIPIIPSKPEEEAQTDTIRKSLYHGLWKAIIKLQLNPNTLSNRFYYQDVLDDEIEELLDKLPQSNELIKSKQMMKAQLIEKTIDTNDQIFNTASGKSYKQQLVDNVTHVPRKDVGITGLDVVKTCEDIHKLNIAETFLIYTMYDKDSDVVKANVFKKKLMKQIQEFFEALKRTQGVEMSDIDFKTYKDDILNDLFKVPSPSDQTIREEADEVLIGLEIEQWFQDLPLYEASTSFETLCRKRYRDTLAQKVHEMEKENNLADCEDKLRHEITRFMTKLPIRENEIEYTPFMVEELVNRLKNRTSHKSMISGPVNKLAHFVEANDYDDFSRNMPGCSSFSKDAGTRPAKINESSYYVRDGERIDSPCCQFQHVQARNTSATSEQWYSLQADGAHKPALTQAAQGGESQFQQGQIGDTSAQPQQWYSSHKDTTEIPDCCQFSNGASAMIFQQPSYRGQDVSVKQKSIMKDPNLHASGFKDRGFNDQRSPEPQSPEQSNRTPEYPMLQQDNSLTSERISEPPRIQEQIALPPCCRTRFSERQSSPRMERYLEPRMPSVPEGRISEPFSAPRRSSESNPNQYQGNMFVPPNIYPEHFQQLSSAQQQSSFHGKVPAGSYLHPDCCLKPNQTRSSRLGHSSDAMPGRSTDVYEAEPSTKQIPGSTGQSSGRMEPTGFTGQHFASSTPQNGGPLARESRPKKRSRERDRCRRDESDSDDSVGEEVRCRCMERILRCRKKRPIHPPCDECDIKYPPCFPFRFSPYPYFY